jgi:hypothetical protein
MTASFFHRLSKQNQKVYLASDKIKTVALSDTDLLKKHSYAIKQALLTANVVKVENSCQQFIDQICLQCNLVAAHTHVLEKRPHNQHGELHGLYEPVDITRKQAKIYVWMRTAKRQQVVAFKTFLRTLIHEFCHHLDYEYFHLADSFHTQGFFQRESNIYKQIIT